MYNIYINNQMSNYIKELKLNFQVLRVQTFIQCKHPP